MREIGEAIQAYILAGCAVAMGIVLLAVIVRMVAGAAISFRRVPCAAAISLMALWFTYIGGTKPEQVMIRFDEGLYNDGTEVSTNNPHMITFRWRYDSWIPPVTTVTVSANLIGATNGTIEVGTTSITNRQLIAYMETDATNYMYFVEQSYNPEPSVVTNGVYHIQCFDGVDVWIPKGLTIYGDGVSLSWPDGTPIPAKIDEKDYVDNISEGEE